MRTVSFLIFTLLIIVGCSERENNPADSPIERASDSSKNVPVESLDSATIALIEWDEKYDVYQGNFFSIEYPSNFTASPKEPVITKDNYEFIDTDEATFTGPNSEVEFFVYSPLWGGDPAHYLTQQSNEKITEEKTTNDSSEVGLEKVIKWVTYSDKEGKYSRSYVSTKTESTHVVFGIKTKNDAIYKKYKDAYVRFKSSLTQFMDN